MWVSAVFAVWLRLVRCSAMGAIRKSWQHPASFRGHRCCSFKLRTGARYKAHQLHPRLSPNTSTSSSTRAGCQKVFPISAATGKHQAVTSPSYPELLPKGWRRVHTQVPLPPHCNDAVVSLTYLQSCPAKLSPATPTSYEIFLDVLLLLLFLPFPVYFPILLLDFARNTS